MKKFNFSNLPDDILKPIKLWNILCIIFTILVLITWYIALFLIGADTDQGQVYRIIFVHVPVAWCSFFWVFLSAIFGVLVLIKKDKSDFFDRSSHISLELGCVFSFLTLFTGSIWGRPTWGVWWDWDPRLTSSLVMFLVCCAYLVLRHFTPDLKTRKNISAIVSLLSAINVPIVYYSVNLWRSLHQPQTFIQKTKNASSDISIVLLLCTISLFLLSLAIYKIRRQAISAKETLENARGDN